MRGNPAYGDYAEPHRDLRAFLARVKEADELTEIDNASWDPEMGTLAEIVYHGKPDNPPALLFNNIPGFPEGFRTLSGATNSARRLAITLGFPRPANPMDVVRSYRERMTGHARQAALLAASCQSGSYLGRYVVVVDEDVDPTDTFGLLWAISTRADPARDIMIFDRAWSGPLDPLLDPASRTNSRAIIDACRPFEKMDEFPRVVQASDELRARVERKFSEVLGNI